MGASWSHFIKKVEISLNNQEEPLVYKFFFQRGDYKRFTVEIPELEKTQKVI